jgi:hypothetical protein
MSVVGFNLYFMISRLLRWRQAGITINSHVSHFFLLDVLAPEASQVIGAWCFGDL